MAGETAVAEEIIHANIITGRLVRVPGFQEGHPGQVPCGERRVRGLRCGSGDAVTCPGCQGK